MAPRQISSKNQNGTTSNQDRQRAEHIAYHIIMQNATVTFVLHTESNQLYKSCGWTVSFGLIIFVSRLTTFDETLHTLPCVNYDTRVQILFGARSEWQLYDPHTYMHAIIFSFGGRNTHYSRRTLIISLAKWLRADYAPVLFWSHRRKATLSRDMVL